MFLPGCHRVCTRSCCWQDPSQPFTPSKRLRSGFRGPLQLFLPCSIPFYRQVVPLQLVENRSSDSVSGQWGLPPSQKVWTLSEAAAMAKKSIVEAKFNGGHKNKPFLRGMKNFLISKQRIDVMSGPIETSEQVASLGQALSFRENWP